MGQPEEAVVHRVHQGHHGHVVHLWGESGATALAEQLKEEGCLCCPGWLLGPYPQVVKDIADKGDVADPALQGPGSQLLPSLVLLLQPVEESPPEDTLACLLALGL